MGGWVDEKNVPEFTHVPRIGVGKSQQIPVVFPLVLLSRDKNRLTSVSLGFKWEFRVSHLFFSVSAVLQVDFHQSLPFPLVVEGRQVHESRLEWVGGWVAGREKTVSIAIHPPTHPPTYPPTYLASCFPLIDLRKLPNAAVGNEAFHLQHRARRKVNRVLVQVGGPRIQLFLRPSDFSSFFGLIKRAFKIQFKVLEAVGVGGWVNGWIE